MRESISWRLNRFFVKCPRIVCLVYELARAFLGKFQKENTPCWYYFCARKNEGGSNKIFSAPLLKNSDKPNWFSITRPFHIHEHIHFNFDEALQACPNLRGIAFIFFMGAGDYLYATPLFKALKEKYPHVDFIAIAGDKNDRNNSSLVAKLLKNNTCFSKVLTFSKGKRHSIIWKNYDYRNALELVPENYLAVPVYYDYSTEVSHRVHSLFETYGLPLPAGGNIEKVPAPLMYFNGLPSEQVSSYLNEIDNMCKNSGKSEIVFLQLDSRGSNYAYPFIKELAQNLNKQSVVLSVTQGIARIKDCLELDIKRLEMNDTFRLLSLLKERYTVRIIAVNSVFWAASAGLDIPNLGLQHWYDSKLHNLWYPNITFLTSKIYEKIPQKYQIIAAKKDWQKHNKKIIDFLPSFVYEKYCQTFYK